MSYLTRLLAGPTTSLTEADERYWGAVGTGSSAGVRVNTETALKLSTVWACSRLLAETVASLPMHVYRRLSDGGREMATNHPLYTVLHDQPNAQQTAFEFVDYMTHCAIMRGNGYAEIIAGPRGFADQIVPLQPDKVRPEVLVNGRIRYEVTRADGRKETLSDEELLHLKGPSFDGKLGVSVVSYARESLGTSLARQAYAGRFYRNNSNPGGILTHPGKLKKDGRNNLRESWEESHQGENQHRVAVLEEGVKWESTGVSQKDAQYIEAEEFGAEDMCRWFRVPPHLVGLTSKATSWGSGIEQMGIGFVTYTLMPWLIRWQQAITRDLILAPQTYFVEFMVNALLRGDLKSRYDAYAVARSWGWMSANDVRRKENDNPIENGDIYLQPLNMIEAGVQPPPAQQPQRGSSAHYDQLLREAAARVVRKEVAALSKAAKRASGDEWAVAVHNFYLDHAEHVAQSLCVALDVASAYAVRCESDLLERGPSALNDWEDRHIDELTMLVLETA